VRHGSEHCGELRVWKLIRPLMQSPVCELEEGAQPIWALDISFIKREKLA